MRPSPRPSPLRFGGFRRWGEVGLLRGVEMTLRAPLGASGPRQPALAIDLSLLLTLLVVALGALRIPLRRRRQGENL